MNEYDNYLLLDLGLTTALPAFTAVVEQVSADVQPILSRKIVTKRTFRSHLALILLNLLKAFQQNHNRYVAYSRNRNSYYPHRQGLKVNYCILMAIISVLFTLGLIEGPKGINYPYYKRLPRMRATDHLKQLFRPIDEVFPMDLIILHDENHKPISFLETEETKRIRENIRLINECNGKHIINHCIPPEEFNNDKPAPDLTQWKLRRVFNENFDGGGRFYGGWWIGLSKNDRSFIRIDGEVTSELDFTATLISLVYLDKGLKLPKDDPYSLSGIPPQNRDFLKLAINIMLNSKSNTKALQALNLEILKGEAQNQTHLSNKKIICLLEERHNAIKDSFFKGVGVRFQRIESDIAENIMLRLVKKNIPVLPIHDAFIVKNSDVPELEKAMQEVVAARYNSRIPFKAPL